MLRPSKVEVPRLDLLDQLQDLRLNRHIECGRRLIADQQVWITGQRDRDHDTLPHTTGELVRIVLHPLLRLLDADLAKQLDRTLPGILLLRLIVPDHALHDLLSDVHRRIEGGHRILEHHGDPLTIDMCTDPLLILFEDFDRLGLSICVGVGEADGACIDRRVLREDAHGGLHRDRLTGAGLTDDGDRLPLVKVNVYAPDGMHHPGRRLKADIKILDLENFFSLFCHLTSPSSSDRVPHGDHRRSG